MIAATLEEEIKEHKDESDSSKSDHHWKKPLKKAKVSGDDLDKKGSSALGVPNVPPLTPVSKPTEQFLRPSALLEEIHRSKMTVGGKSIGSPPSKGDACPEEPLQKVSLTYAPLKYSESPLDASNRQITRNPEPSQWVGEKVVSNFFKKTALYGLTTLEEYLNSYLKRVDNFNDVQSSYSAQLLSTDKARQLDEKTSAIEEALTLMEQLREDAKVIQERATHLSLENKELERRFQSINVESKQLSLSCEKTEAIDQQELEVAKLQDEVNTLKDTPTITEEVIEALVTVCRSMEAAREEFKNFK
ncbi:hypothetical protein E5676_scaffold3607G00180 [Cucumis melo var. makuwa]|uniref:Uncharacterized protein n=1 Tax=Cucumis melo var. makuwa TaxID=1194695 RepID=A0A5D3E1Q2_CUCMM|nr:hypothetical protein E5676_scaffold3607G00180 [Cucumis melo var. makuwa]